MVRTARQVIPVWRGYRVDTEAEALRFWHEYGRTVGFREVTPHRRSPRRIDTPAVAYISDNRWVADCDCGSGIACDPHLPVACCFGCGTIRPIVFPPDADEIADTLEVRLTINRNWLPHETVDDLRAQNKAHGLPERYERRPPLDPPPADLIDPARVALGKRFAGGKE